MDWVPWVIRAVLIVVGIIMAIMVGKRKKRYYFGIIVIGCTAFTIGVILLILSFITDLFWDYALFLTAVGAILIIIGLVSCLPKLRNFKLITNKYKIILKLVIVRIANLLLTRIPIIDVFYQ